MCLGGVFVVRATEIESKVTISSKLQCIVQLIICTAVPRPFRLGLLLLA